MVNRELRVGDILCCHRGWEAVCGTNRENDILVVAPLSKGEWSVRFLGDQLDLWSADERALLTNFELISSIEEAPW
jgi:hypothetical protein